ncbi:DUF6063 family protein [Virgibacillus flavescens]|uniref:DUF6063 family protein n=1 Tax=Virgibacillus flavescens TaxID=1611422 RepID=UPI003D330CE0
MIETEKVKEAYTLFQTVMIRGSIDKNRDPDLFHSYLDPDIRDIIRQIFQPVSQSKIVQVDQTLYFVPEMENDTFAYSNSELLELMKLKDNKQLYFAQFIFMNLLSEFFGDQFLQTGETRAFIKVDEIMARVNEYMQNFDQKSEEELEELQTRYELDIRGMLETWKGLSDVTEDIKDLSKATKRDYGFFLKVLRFWENEKLIIIREKEEISLTDKMKNISNSFYHNGERITRMQELLDEIKEINKEGGEGVYA